MDSVKKECQIRRAEEQVQRHVVVLEYYHLSVLLQNTPSAPVWNKERGRGRRRRIQTTPIHVLQNLEDTILDLHRHWHNEQHQLQIIEGSTFALDHLYLLSREQQQRITQEYRVQIMRVEAERQRQIEER